MEPALMMRTALALLTVTALGGVVMGWIRIGRKTNPWSWLAMLHGLLAGSALTLLLYAHFTTGLPTLADWATLAFLVAAAGGVFLNLCYHSRGKLLSAGYVVAHASIAVVGYVLLAITVFGIR